MRQTLIHRIAGAVGALLVLLVSARVNGQVEVGPGFVDAPFVHVEWFGGRVHVCAPFVNLDVPAPGCWRNRAAPICGAQTWDASNLSHASRLGKSAVTSTAPAVAVQTKGSAIAQQIPFVPRKLIAVTARDIARSGGAAQSASSEELPAPPRPAYPSSIARTSRNAIFAGRTEATNDDRPVPQDASALGK